MLYPDVMIDIETTGTDPSHAAIIQIAAVKFDLQRHEVCPDFFCVSLTVPNNKFWEQGTLDFWGRNREVYNSIMRNALPPKDVMESLSNWCLPVNNEYIHLWASPITFEYPMLQAYFQTFNVMNPFHYRRTYDMWSYICGLYNTTTPPKFDIQFEGKPHNAIDDVLHQLRVLFHAQSEANSFFRRPSSGTDVPSGSTLAPAGSSGADGNEPVSEPSTQSAEGS